MSSNTESSACESFAEGDDEDTVEVTLECGSEDEWTTFDIPSSILLTSIVQECAQTYLERVHYREQEAKKSLGLRKESDDLEWQTSSQEEQGEDDVDCISFARESAQLSQLLERWEGLMLLGQTGSFGRGVKALELSVAVVKFIGRVKAELTDFLQKSVEAGEREWMSEVLSFSFLTNGQLKIMTEFFCHLLYKSSQRSVQELSLLLRLSLDALEVLLESVAINVNIGPQLLGDWFFLISIPWQRKLGKMLPMCQSVKELNSVADFSFTDDTLLQRRCISLLRFEVFFPFREGVRNILMDVMSAEVPISTCLDVLKIISGLWWPIQLFRWTQLFQYCSFVFSQRGWEVIEELAVALTEAFVRLPCAYAEICRMKKLQGTQKPFVPKWRDCGICRKDYNKTTSSRDLKKFKMTPADELKLRAMFREMLTLKRTRVHLVLLNLLISIRRHTRLRVLTYTRIFFDIYSAGNLAVRLKAVDIFGFCTRQTEGKKKIRKKSGVVVNRSAISSTTATSRYATSRGPGQNKDQQGSGSARGNNSLPPRSLKVPTKGKLTKGPSAVRNLPSQQANGGFRKPINPSQNDRASSIEAVRPYTSRRDILLRSKSAFVEKPPLGRFDAALMLYNGFVSDFYVALKHLPEDGVQLWNILLGFHLGFANLSRGLDGDVWMVEIIKCYLRMVAKFDMRTLLVFARRAMSGMAGRCGCTVRDLFGRFRETLAEEIKNICCDHFFDGAHLPANDERSIKLCQDYFLKIQIISGSIPLQAMMTLILRPVLKRCILTMFQDNKANIVAIAICGFVEKKSSLAEVLESEFPYYYTYALLHSSPADCRGLIKGLKESFHMKPPNPRQCLQQLHIEMLSHIFEHRENVIQSYGDLLELDQRVRQSTSRLVKAIGADLDRWYIGVFLYFESKFLSSSEAILSKRRYLGCFTMLIGLLGKQKVTSSRLKLYSILNSLRTMGSEFHDLLFQAWRAYSVNLTEEALCQMANQITAGINYLRDTRNVEVDSLCKLILTHTGSNFGDRIRHLHFLDHVSQDASVKARVQGVLGDLRNSNPSGFFHQLVSELGHENSHVRYQALVTLEEMLRGNMLELQDLQFQDPLFSAKTTLLLRNLLNATKGGDERVEELCASCIGMMGALDPRRFDLKAQLSENARFGLTVFTVGETDFLKFILEELSRVLQASVDAKNFDSCAFCIQEMIGLYGIRKAEDDPVWSQLSAKTQDLMVPLFTSRYVKSETTNSSLMPSPVYLSQHGQTLNKWLHSWIVKLISVITSVVTRKCFEALALTVDKSEQLGLVILPYVVSYAIMDGDMEGRNAFLQELDAVRKSWVDSKQAWMSCPDLSQSSKDQCSNPSSDDSELDSVPRSSYDSEMDHLRRKLKRWTESSCAGAKDMMMRRNENMNPNQFAYSAAQAIFKVLDHLQRLVRNPKQKLKKRESEPETQSQVAEKRAAARSISVEESEPITQAQKLLCYDVLSQWAFQCRNFARSLMYIEEHLRSRKQEDFTRSFQILQRIYVSLADEDSVKGLEAKRKQEITTMEDALNKLSLGKLETCIPLFETVLSEDPEDLLNHQQLVQAYLGLDKYHVSKLLLEGACSRRPQWSRSFDEASLEICIKTGSDKELEERIQELSCEKLSSWGKSVSEALLNYSRGHVEISQENVRQCKLNLIKNMCDGAAFLDMEFHFRHYHDLIRLQLLSELGEMQRLVLEKERMASGELAKNFQSLQHNWDRRLKCSYKSMENLQTMISFRKTLLTTAKKFFCHDERMIEALNGGLRECYVKLAKLESSLGNYSRAEQLFSECKLATKLSVFYEEGKMLYQAGRYNESMKVLQVGMASVDRAVTDEYNNLSASTEMSPEQHRFAKTFLLYAIQKDEQRKADHNLNIENYRHAISLNERSEKNYFYMALYYDRLWSQCDGRDRNTQLQTLMVQNYGLSLTSGCNYLYQSLPRMLTIWFDYAAQIQGLAGAPKTTSSPPADSVIVLQLTECIRNLLKNAPTYIFIVAFTQLISRLAHANQVVFNELKEVIVHMITVHPDQVLWMMLSVLKSTYPKRVNRCNDILKLAEQKKPALRATIRSYKALGDKLIQFTNKKTEHTRFAKVSELLPALPKLIRAKEFCNVLVPFENFMRPALPRGGKYAGSYNPFPEKLVYIEDILEPVQVMASLQKPKKISFVGTNGKFYPVMCKPSDDLRKDAKMMEINNMVHWYMSRDKESRKRGLIVRTYTVTPLRDDCGIMEWIPNLQGYRPLIFSLYKDNVGFAPGQPRILRPQACDRNANLATKRKVFMECMKNHPSVMSYWFLKAFHDPQSWYMARTSFVRTAAVTSIIGFLMGLGDRHGENILLDSSSGDVVHVDYNCLFNKGETFDWPERVPFRLTRNMIDGMGPLGVEGPFRYCCEIVMRLIRNHSSVFLSIIRPFIFDPLVEWESHFQQHSKSTQVGECNNPRAVEHLNNIRDRLLGSARNMTKEINVALSVEAHVNYLIKEAEKVDNLCQMYIGWAGYL